MPDPYFPDFSQIVICLQVKVVQATALKSTIPLQMARPALAHTIQTDANMGCCS